MEILSVLSKLIRELENLLIFSPIQIIHGRIGNMLRGLYYRRRLKHMGKGVTIDLGAIITHPENVSIGDNTYIDKYVIILSGQSRRNRITYFKENNNFKGEQGEVYIGKKCHLCPYTQIQGHGGVRLGDNIGVAAGSRIYSLSNHYRNLVDRQDPRKYLFTNQSTDENQTMISGPVVMEDNSALGSDSVVLPGVTIGKGSWVGSMSLVLMDIEPNVIASGNPVKILKNK